MRFTGKPHVPDHLHPHTEDPISHMSTVERLRADESQDQDVGSATGQEFRHAARLIRALAFAYTSDDTTAPAALDEIDAHLNVEDPGLRARRAQLLFLAAIGLAASSVEKAFTSPDLWRAAAVGEPRSNPAACHVAIRSVLALLTCPRSASPVTLLVVELAMVRASDTATALALIDETVWIAVLARRSSTAPPR